MEKIASYECIRLEHGQHQRLPQGNEFLLMVGASGEIENVAYRCPCGCNHTVVLPVGPVPIQKKCWGLTQANGLLTITPSVDQIGYTCRSHYHIDAGKVRWAGEPLPVPEEFRFKDRKVPDGEATEEAGGANG
jgi:Family of unknown function (DUF6527)